MRSIKFIALFLLLSIVACSTTNSQNPAELYKNYSAERLYQEGKKALSDRSYSSATKYFEALNVLYPFGSYAESGNLSLIYTYFQAEDYASTVAAANRFIHLYPRSPNVDYAYYMKGLGDINQSKLSVLQQYVPVDVAARDLTNAHQAFFDFRDLVQLYPHSRYAPDARQRMVYLRNLFAQHELEIAEYYFKRGAWVAAANRASYIVEHFPYTPQIRPALIILVKANRQLGLEEPATEALRVLKANFPNAKV